MPCLDWLVSTSRSQNMQRPLLNRATMRVADTTDVSGRVTADGVNLDICKGGPATKLQYRSR